MTVHAFALPAGTPASPRFADSDPADDEVLRAILGSVSRRLSLNASFIVERDGGRRLLGGAQLSSAQLSHGIAAMLQWPLVAQEAPAEITLPWCIPVRLATGERYGLLCCHPQEPEQPLQARDRGALELAAELMGHLLDHHVETHRRRKEILARVRDVLDNQRFTTVFQPIVDVCDGTVIAYEGLTRFHAEPHQGPDRWLADAALVGLRETLELALMANALEHLPALPADAYLSLNISPSTVLMGGLHQLLEHAPLDRLVLEITEHDAIEDYGPLGDSLASLRDAGLHLAIDDAGAGYASFRHVLKLRPQVIKLDRSITQGIDVSPEQQALAGAMLSFARRTGSRLVAEGVETPAERDTLLELGIRFHQGYLLGRPAPLARAM
jgi:EAL domain-containing protein (putative c-di-GMP-specific phosphodiesterase class I)